jgi:hypothetical protein
MRQEINYNNKTKRENNNRFYHKYSQNLQNEIELERKTVKMRFSDKKRQTDQAEKTINYQHVAKMLTPSFLALSRTMLSATDMTVSSNFISVIFRTSAAL